MTLDGVDLRDLSQSELRRHVVMVTQENFMFDGTVADNIRFGRPDATDAEVAAAAAAVGADRFIDALPDGYDTDVAKRGGRLSAGQRQLVAFARAFLADPAVLILDEATSSLDIPSERMVQRALETVLADRTALVIAHRLSTVQVADRVLVLEHGRIVEDGAPDDLIGRTAAGTPRCTARGWSRWPNPRNCGPSSRQPRPVASSVSSLSLMAGSCEVSTEMIFSRARSLTAAVTWCRTLSRAASTQAIMSGSENHCS